MNTARVQLVMNRNFETFDHQKRTALLGDLANALGIDVGDLENPVFRKGCVILEFDLPEATAERFVGLIQKVLNGDANATELQEMDALCKQQKIRSVNIERKSRLTIFSKRYSTPPQEIVLVHGWRGKADSFGKLPHILETRFQCQVRPYEYPAKINGTPPDLYTTSKNLCNKLEISSEARVLGVVAHSMGGVVVRRLLASQLAHPDESTQRIKTVIFAASPRGGSALADLGTHIPGIAKEQLRDLSPKSGFMVHLNDDWREWVKLNVPDRCRISAIYGTSDQVIPPAQASDYDGDSIPLYEDHVSIVKPENDNSDVALTIINLLIKGGLTAVQSNVKSTAPVPRQATDEVRR
jgi:pimeloyl-ACP methyl ester carboxylesterase